MKATTKRKKQRPAKPTPAPSNPWLVNDDTTYEEKIAIARALTLLVRGALIVKHDPGVFVTFDGSNEDSGNGTRGRIWTIDLRTGDEFLNDLSRCLCDIEGGDMRQVMADRLKALSSELAELACDVLEHEIALEKHGVPG